MKLPETWSTNEKMFASGGQGHGFAAVLAEGSFSYPASSERYQLTDIDGEDAFIRIGSIAMVRVLLDAMKPVEEDDE